MSEIKVMASAAIKEAYLALVPEFERATGHRVTTQWVPTVQMLSRLKGGEIVDLIIMSAASIDALIAAQVIPAGSRHDLVRSGIGMAVKAGAPRPDISTGEAVKRAVLAARSVAYSTGPSGVYLTGLFERMGIAAQIRDKVVQVQGEPAGLPVARGDAEIGFQQVSELLPVPGIDLVGPLPPDIQEITIFSAGPHARASSAAAAVALIRHLQSPASAPVMRAKGMDPV